MRVCVIIPTFNESATIGRLIEQIRGFNIGVVVVDDGSTDATALISQNYGAIVLRNSKNQGKGASLICGLRYALDNNFDAMIMMDGDGQHLPENIPEFLKRLKSTSAGILIGNRMLNPKGMPLIRILTNKFMSWLISKIVKQHIPDTQCGFRLIKKELIKKIKFTTRRFEAESEMLIQASRLGYKIESVPIKSIYHKQKSQINPFFDTIRFIKFFFRQIWTTQC